MFLRVFWSTSRSPCFCRSQDRGAVQTLFAKMKASGYVDVISFNTLLKATHGARSAKVTESARAYSAF